jgi:hypothetical protein
VGPIAERAIFDGTGSAIYLLADMDWFTIYCLGKALLFAAFWIAVMWVGGSNGRPAKPAAAQLLPKPMKSRRRITLSQLGYRQRHGRSALKWQARNRGTPR